MCHTVREKPNSGKEKWKIKERKKNSEKKKSLKIECENESVLQY